MVYRYTVEKKENQSQMFNRNNLKMMMVEVCEKIKEMMVWKLWSTSSLWTIEFDGLNIAMYCHLISLSSVH